MGKYINWYLVELEQRLRPEVGEPKTREMLNELELHLQASSDEEMSKGKSVDDAERSAIEAFGTPDTVADSLLGRRPLKMHPAVPILATLLASLFLILFTLGWTVGNEFPALALAVAALTLVVISSRNKRLHVGAIALIAVGGTLVQLMVGSVVYAPFPHHRNSTSFISHGEAKLALNRLAVGPREKPNPWGYSREEEMSRLRRALKASPLESAAYFLPQAPAVWGVAFVGLIVLNWGGYSLGMLSRKLNTRRRRIFA